MGSEQRTTNKFFERVKGVISPHLFVSPAGEATEPEGMFHVGPEEWKLDPEQLPSGGGELYKLVSADLGDRSWFTKSRWLPKVLYFTFLVFLIVTGGLILYLLRPSVPVPTWVPLAQGITVGDVFGEEIPVLQAFAFWAMVSCFLAYALSWILLGVYPRHRVPRPLTSRVTMLLSTGLDTMSVEPFYLVDEPTSDRKVVGSGAMYRPSLRGIYDAQVQLREVARSNFTTLLLSTRFLGEAETDGSEETDAARVGSNDEVFITGEIAFNQRRFGDALQPCDSLEDALQGTTDVGQCLDGIITDFSLAEIDAQIQIVAGAYPYAKEAIDKETDRSKNGDTSTLLESIVTPVLWVGEFVFGERSGSNRSSTGDTDRIANLAEASDKQFMVNVRVLAVVANDKQRREAKQLIKQVRTSLHNLHPPGVSVKKRIDATDSVLPSRRRRAKRVIRDFHARRLRTRLPGLKAFVRRRLQPFLPMGKENILHLLAVSGKGLPESQGALDTTAKDQSPTQQPPPGDVDSLTGEIPSAGFDDD